MTDSLFFWLSKLIWMIIRPDFLLVAFAVMGMIFWFSGAVKKAKWVLACVVLAMIVITVFPLGTILLAPLEHRFPTNPILPEKVDGIIMLGGAEKNLLTKMWHQPELNDAADRYIGFARLVRAYPDAVHIFTGGSGTPTHQEWSDANTARQVFMDMGLDTSSIVFENQSRNTYENGLFAKTLVHPETGQIWVLVTTAAHIPRSVGVFNRLDWPVIPYPVDHFTRPDRKIKPGLNFSGNLGRLVMAATEWTGLAAYYITGKTNTLFPSSQ
ncbi:YdcF family protein [Desulfobacter hydrogenophilus]|uniref:YdcF family protein n=1 Tax=Desulfobacter hydrogenophilus TaxID=2291 RepID=A0A328FDP7_9BACT|nr:YdcF family protein [Desulfobacter hydrogenophilus]NDY73828.1 YdcF family protein [Desulfobacter hydrogenophilus]QBH13693.1 YdcF family protein [Desulfobacter hydrogenophilus]RAM01880.1 YdcF family protein [Desulfobacter hydrogenophilus]